MTTHHDPFPSDGSLPFGSITLGGQRVPIRLHTTLPIYMAISIVSGLRFAPMYAAFNFVVQVVILFVTVFIHELGHSQAAIGQGGQAHSITLWPLGGFACVSHPKGPKADIWVALAGPLTHIPMCILWYCLLGLMLFAGYVPEEGGFGCDVAASQKCFWVRVVSAAAIMQIQLFCFNLFVPAYPLDCSRILANVLMLRQVEVNRAAYITAAISTPIGLAILGYGIWGFYTGGLYYSLNIFMAIFILYGTYGLWQAGYRGEADRHPMFAHYNRGLQQVSSTKSSQGGRTADFSGVGV